MSDELLLLGDSVTVGAGFSGVDDQSCYVSLLRTELRSAGAQMNIRASALDGADTGYALRRFDRMVARLSPDVIVISLGLNDARPPGCRTRNSPDRYAENLERLTEKSLAIDVRPILCTPPPRLDFCQDGQPARETMRPYAQAARSVAEKYNLPLIELYDEFISRHDLESLLPDRLHPGRAGHEIIARQFARTLVPFCTGQELESLPSRRDQNFEFVTAD
jgi:lysophospholipase L1-like esterase